MNSSLRHEFLNNCLRIEVLNRLIGEKLERNEEPDEEHKSDLKKFLEIQLLYLKEL